MNPIDAELDALAPLATTRAGVYEVLAALYLQPPSRDLVAALLELAAAAMADLSSRGSAGDLLRRYAGSYKGELEALQQEFNDLFTVPLGRYVTPYEAVYRDERMVGEERLRGLLMGPATLAVLTAYREASAVMPPDCPELPDYIGIELNFMAFLCARESAAWQAGDEAAAWVLLRREQRFLAEHLLQWVPALSRRITQNARSDFFRGIALLTDEFLRADAATLAEASDRRQCLTSDEVTA